MRCATKRREREGAGERPPMCDRHWRGWRRYAQQHDHARYHDYGGASLGKRLLVTFVVASLLSIGLAIGALQWLLTWHLPAVVAHGLDEQAHWIAGRIVYDAAGRPAALRRQHESERVEGIADKDWKYRVVDARGTALLSSDPGAAALAPDGERFDPARKKFDVMDGGLTMHVATLAIEHAGQPFYVQTGVSERFALMLRGGLVVPLLENALGVAAITLVLFAIGTHATLRHLLWPLWRASSEAERIDPRNLQARLATAWMPRELRPLTAAFNRALDRLEKGYRTQQEFLAAAAHELKTPLALIRGQVELSDSPDRATLLGDIDRMSRQVQQLLQLAEASEVGNYKFERLDLGAAACEAIAFVRRLAERAGVLLELRSPEVPVERDADRGAIFALVKNLVENAIQHSAPGALVTVQVDAAGLAVRNAGEPVPEEHLDKLFTRFWRGPSRRDTGAGLGLAICQEIAQAHGWRVEARNVEDGVEFRVAFGGD
jgi:two-component system sensor histidine kinase QseC